MFKIMFQDKEKVSQKYLGLPEIFFDKIDFSFLDPIF